MAEPAAVDLWGKLVSFIREFGLPSFLVIWFLFRIEKKLERFTKSLNRLLTVNVVMLKTLDKDDEADKLLAEDAAADEKGLVAEVKEEVTGEHHKSRKTRKKVKAVEGE